jgi:hypothetical protein
MEPTAASLQGLSNLVKMTLLDSIVLYPNTESISPDIQKAEQLGVVLNYTNLDTDIEKIVSQILKDPRFNQLSSRNLNIEVLRSLLLKPDLNYNSVDFIYFQMIKTPTLCLKNTNNEIGARGVSIFIDLNDVRIQIYRVASLPERSFSFLRDLGPALIAGAILAAGYLISRNQLPLK